MTSIQIHKNGTPITSFTIPVGQGVFTWHFADGYMLTATPLIYGATYTTTPDQGLTAAAVDRMTQALVQWADELLKGVQEDRDFWRQRALALETEVPPPGCGPRMPYSGNSSATMSVIPPKSSSAWPTRPLGSVRRNFSLAPKARV